MLRAVGAKQPCARVLGLLGRVAELADAQDSGSCVRKDVGVQLPPRPPFLSAGYRSRSCKHFARGRAFPIMTMPAPAHRTTTESSPAITAAVFEDFYRAHHREVY